MHESHYAACHTAKTLTGLVLVVPDSTRMCGHGSENVYCALFWAVAITKKSECVIGSYLPDIESLPWLSVEEEKM